MKKKLYKDKENAMISGVCAGISDYFDFDVSLVRIVAVILAFGSAFGIVAYIAAAIVLPSKGSIVHEAEYESSDDDEEKSIFDE